MKKILDYYYGMVCDMWIYLTLLYGILKGAREITKKLALNTSSATEVLLLYTVISFLIVCLDVKNSTGMEPRFYIYTAIKAFVIFVAWICSFEAIKLLPISVYGILDLSRVIASTILGVIILGERISFVNFLGLLLVCTGLLLLKFKPSFISKKETIDGKEAEKIATVAVIVALISCILNSVSAIMDKILMKDISSSQLQFWYMFFLSFFYITYAIITRAKIDIKSTLKNKYIWLLSIMYVIADKALFIANGIAESEVTVMTLIKQSGCIVTIIGGRLIFKEKNIVYKLCCAVIMIVGIILGLL